MCACFEGCSAMREAARTLLHLYVPLHIRLCSFPCSCRSLTVYDCGLAETSRAVAVLGSMTRLTALSLGLHACCGVEGLGLDERIEVRGSCCGLERLAMGGCVDASWSACYTGSALLGCQQLPPTRPLPHLWHEHRTGTMLTEAGCAREP